MKKEIELSLTDDTHSILPFLKDAIGALEEGFALYDKDMRFVLCNDQYLDLVFSESHPALEVGQDGAEIAAMVFASETFLLPEKMKLKELVSQTMEFVKIYGRGLELKRADGRIIECCSNKTGLGGYLITVLDITDRSKLEDGSRKMLNDVAESLDQAIALYDADMNFLFSNKLYVEEYFDKSAVLSPQPGEKLGDQIRRLADANHFKKVDGLTTEDIVNFTIQNTRKYSKNDELELADGRIVSGSAHKTELGGYFITLNDVTIKRQTEKRVRGMFNDVLETLHEGVALLDDDGRLTLFNDNFLQMFGLPDDPTLYGKSFDDVLNLSVGKGLIESPPDMKLQELIRLITKQVLDGAVSIEIPVQTGTLLGTSSVTPLGGRLITVDDITDKLESEAKSMTAVNEAIQALDLGLVLWDADLKLVIANEQWFEMFFSDSNNPQVGDSLTEVMDRLLEVQFFKIPDEISAQQYSGLLVDYIKNYAKKVTFDTNDGRIIMGSSNATGLGGYLISFSDITEQQKTQEELEKQREISHQNEKLSALGELLAGVAHELNNPLTVIVGYAQMLEGKTDDPVLSRRVERIYQAAERSAKIVKTFLAMARQRPTRIENCSLNEIVMSALDISGYGLRANGTNVKLELDNDLPSVSGDDDQLTQVFTNLIVNAEHAVSSMGQKGELVLRSSYDVNADRLVVEICDNGAGISEDIQARIFEPFFTTKDVGVGTGIGLAFSHRIVDAHGGFLDLKSELGRGSVFSVHLPVSSTLNLESGKTEIIEDSDSICRVLIIDDEENVANFIYELLEECGMDVKVLTSARDALSLLKAEEFDVILSDYKMPGMSGASFLNALQETAPQLVKQVGFITGDTMGDDVAEFIRETNSPYIEKPIIKEELLSLIRSLYTSVTEEQL
jgi:signal transduction histidine kinase/CheY-like chemotaxis protein